VYHLPSLKVSACVGLKDLNIVRSIMDDAHLNNSAYFRPWPYQVWIQEGQIIVQKDGQMSVQVPENDEGRRLLDQNYHNWREWIVTANTGM
jgi:hypothetical protein